MNITPVPAHNSTIPRPADAPDRKTGAILDGTTGEVMTWSTFHEPEEWRQRSAWVMRWRGRRDVVFVKFS